MAASYGRWMVTTLREAGWAPMLVFVMHLVAFFALDAYTRYPPIDIPAHVLGGFVIAFFFHRMSINASRFGVIGPFHPTTHAALVMGLVCLAAVVWEFAEWSYDRLLGARLQDDLDDTLLDLLLGLVGGAGFLLVGSGWTKKGGQHGPNAS